MGNRVQKNRIEQLEERIAASGSDVEDVPDETGGIDYTNPEQQQRILNPPTIPVELDFEDGRESKIVNVRTQFTQDMVGRRGVLDRLNALAQLILAELSSFVPGGALPTQEWINANPAYLGAAACQPRVCERTRELVAMLSDTPAKEIEDGVDATTLAQLTVALVTLYHEHVKKTPRGRAAP